MLLQPPDDVQSDDEIPNTSPTKTPQPRLFS
jgi:hypothetical protein